MTRPPIPVVVLALALAPVGAVVAWRTGATPATPPSQAPSAAPSPALSPTPVDRAVRVLEEWQAARARAYAGADGAALRALYLPRSEAGRSDLTLLREYAARGLALDLAVRSTQLQVLVDRPDRVVVQQRARTEATVRLGREARTLPPTPWSSTRVTLRRVGERWLLSSALRAPGGSPPAPP